MFEVFAACPSRPLRRVVETSTTVALSAAELGAFRLGNPDRPDELVRVDAATLGTDGQGFLSIRDLYGTHEASGEAVRRTYSAEVCGALLTGGCRRVWCLGYGCGDQPGCPCLGTGLCDSWMGSICQGSCPDSHSCHIERGICGCWQIPVPGPGGTPINPNPRPIDIQPKR